MKSKTLQTLQTLQTFYITISIIISIIVIIYIIHSIYKSNNKSINKFEDIPATTALPLPTPMSIPSEAIVQQCETSDNVVGFCLNYTGCCKQQASTNNKCFCDHPHIQDCNNIYDECIKTTPNSPDCKDKLKECCTSYNKINIDINNFDKPIKQIQNSRKICAIGTINGLSTDSVRLKCMELCQTNTNCKAFTIDSASCMLFSDISPLPTKLPGKNDITTDYYIKK
jgi:hypothetical protein